MRYFSFVEQGDDGDCYWGVLMSERQILRDYFPYWKAQMERVGKSAEISEAACVEDFCVVHWAVEAPPDTGARR